MLLRHLETSREKKKEEEKKSKCGSHAEAFLATPSREAELNSDTYHRSHRFLNMDDIQDKEEKTNQELLVFYGSRHLRTIRSSWSRGHCLEIKKGAIKERKKKKPDV